MTLIQIILGIMAITNVAHYVRLGRWRNKDVDDVYKVNAHKAQQLGIKRMAMEIEVLRNATGRDTP